MSAGFTKPVRLSEDMQEFLGVAHTERVSVVEVTRAICTYIKVNNLQNKDNLRQFFPDETLSKLLGTTEPMTYFNLQKYIIAHIIKL